MSRRRIFLVRRPEPFEAVREIERSLRAELAAHDIEIVDEAEHTDAEGCELVVVLGGDGTILRATEAAYKHDVPLLGVNLGHVGFLAEAEPEALPDIVNAIRNRDYTVEERTMLDVRVEFPDGTVHNNWAVNEVVVNKASAAGQIDAAIAVDGREMLSFGADGVLIATPTGSTAYSFSAGGPIVWPDVKAMLLTPIAAHALFSRPLVISPKSTISLAVGTRDGEHLDIACDGRRRMTAPHGTVLEARVAKRRMRLARIAPAAFSGRLVAKFHLPTSSWREHGPAGRC